MSKFSVWVDDINVSSACQSSSEFSTDNQRQAGFKAGTGASSVRVNTALRQANLIAVALVNALGISDDYDIGSSLEDMTSWFENLQMFKMKDLFEVGNPNKLLQSIIPDTELISLGSEVKKFDRIWANAFEGIASDVKCAQTLSTTETAFHMMFAALNSQNSSVSLRYNSSLVYYPKTNSMNVRAKEAVIALYADSDSSKGTIEERLTRLGFKSGVINILGKNYGSEDNKDTYSDGIFRSGNFVIIKVSDIIALDETDARLRPNEVFATIPEGFRPSQNAFYSVIFENSVYQSVGSALYGEIQPDGKMINRYRHETTGFSAGYMILAIRCGFEAPPIE